MAQDIEFNKNEDQNKQKLADLNGRLKKVYLGGGEKRIADHKAKGKMTASNHCRSNETFNSMLQSRIFVISTLIAMSMNVLAQTDTTEVACDTTFNSMRYTRCVKVTPDRVIAWGNRNEQGQRHGWWRELKKNGRLKKQTEYIDDHPVRERWRRGELWRYDDKGNIISKGKADRRAKKVF